MGRSQANDQDGEMDQEDEADDLPREMPVMWHQTVLTLVQCYKSYFAPDQRKKILALLKVQNHYAITPEIRRELQPMAAPREGSNKGADVSMS